MAVGALSMVIPIIASAHTYNRLVRIPATCTEDGKHYLACDKCDEYDENTVQIIPALGHDYVETALKEPTCVDDELTTYTCTRCEDTYIEIITKLEPLKEPPVVTPPVESTVSSATEQETAKAETKEQAMQKR